MGYHNLALVALVINIILAITAGIVADRKGYPAIGWVLLVLFLGILPLLILLALPSVNSGNSSSSSCSKGYTYSPYKNKTSDDYVPSFMRNNEKTTVAEIPKVLHSEDDDNYYYGENRRNWICSHCGEINKIKAESCKKCKKEKGMLKINKYEGNK